MTPEAAERLALAALQWIAARDDIAGSFLAAAGAAPEDLRARAADPAFLGFVLDHLLTRDDWVVGFAQHAGLAPDRVMVARQTLPGGDAPVWT
ncbi:MAG: DUF3572 domain-containing protein [Pseudomonadota bacterium]